MWYKFKEYSPRCACGIVRLLSPVPKDLVGIVTSEDLLGLDFKTSKGTINLDGEMLNDDLSEIQDASLFNSSLSIKSRIENLKRFKSPWSPRDCHEKSPKVEMSLIYPKTRDIFKRSQGGVFGEGNWQVSEIRAFAVWF